MSKNMVYFFVFLLLISISYAATLHGTIYDLSLEKVSDVVVEIDSTPIQRVISTQGEYEFELSQGDYIISAKQIMDEMVVAIAEEEILISDEGDYNLDLFLFPSFEEEESLLEETSPLVEEDYFKTTNYLLIIVIILLIFLIGVVLFFHFKSKKKQHMKPIVVQGSDDLHKVINIIKSQGGRTTQKEIRKNMPLSEAKISLIISELEDNGTIRKIKKGRGNIIILQNQ